MNTQTFIEYLNQQTERQEPVGDIARDAMSDRKWPSQASTISEYHEHLDKAGACDAAHDALDRAWREYTFNHVPDTPVPVLFAVASESGKSLLIFCKFCGKYHTHGRNPEDPIGASDGYRVAHCDIDDSPYSATGYFIREVEGPLPEPAHEIKPRYTRDGSYISGYLAKQCAARNRS